MRELVRDDRAHPACAVAARVGGEHHKGAVDVGVGEAAIGEDAPGHVVAIRHKDRCGPVGAHLGAQGAVGGVGLVEVAAACVAQAPKHVADPAPLVRQAVGEGVVSSGHNLEANGEAEAGQGQPRDPPVESYLDLAVDLIDLGLAPGVRGVIALGQQHLHSHTASHILAQAAVVVAGERRRGRGRREGVLVLADDRGLSLGARAVGSEGKQEAEANGHGERTSVHGVPWCVAVCDVGTRDMLLSL